jgi:cytoskeletal protein CcmA (bactofilin family)
MWRKSEGPKSSTESSPQSNYPVESRSVASNSSNPPATVNHGITIKGEISGEGDLFLDGTFEGKVHLPDGTFTVGPRAHVTAEIEAREIIVLGEVAGTLRARERVHVSSTGKLTGEMDTRGIVIEDGAVLHSKVANPVAPARQPSTHGVAPAEALAADASGPAETTEPSPAPKESSRGRGAAAASLDS